MQHIPCIGAASPRPLASPPFATGHPTTRYTPFSPAFPAPVTLRNFEATTGPAPSRRVAACTTRTRTSSNGTRQSSGAGRPPAIGVGGPRAAERRTCAGVGFTPSLWKVSWLQGAGVSRIVRKPPDSCVVWLCPRVRLLGFPQSGRRIGSIKGFVRRGFARRRKCKRLES